MKNSEALRKFIKEFQTEFKEINLDYLGFAADRFIEQNPDQDNKNLLDDIANLQEVRGMERDVYESEIKHLKRALEKCDVIINNAANMCESSVLKNAMLLSLSSLNLPKLLTKIK